MVTKHSFFINKKILSYVLAKIQMVTKLVAVKFTLQTSYVLAKIQMVTKLDA